MLSKKDKEDILNRFLKIASKYLRTNFTNHSVQRHILRIYFKEILRKSNLLNNQLDVDKCSSNGWIGNIYDYLKLTDLNTHLIPANQHLLSKCIVNIINKCNLSNSDFIKMQHVSKSTKTFTKWANPITKHYQRKLINKHIKHHHHLGIAWIIAILLISLVIPNYAINLTGITFGNFFMYIGHFLLIQFENLINPALIGRILINVIGDVPVIKHYFLNNK